MYDLRLARAQTAALARSYTLLHKVSEDSPLFGYDASRLQAEECELHVTVSGVDDTTLQPVHAVHVYTDSSIRLGHRLVDVLTIQPDGTMVVDVGKFHETVPDESPR